MTIFTEGLAILLLTNRRLTLISRGRRTLTTRYQLTENVKALRLLVPVILLDTLVSFTDTFAKLMFRIETKFNVTECMSSATYFPVFIISRLLSIIAEMMIPVFVIHQHATFLMTLRSYLYRGKNKTEMNREVKVAVVVLYFLISNDHYKSMAMLIFYVINILCLGILLTANNHITSRLAGSGATLTTRYQVTENIRTIRVLLPAALFDALVTLTDIIAMVWFKVDHVFDLGLCGEKQYLYFFLGLTTLSAIFEYLVPISVLLSHPAYRRNASLISIYESRKRTGATVSSSIMMSSDRTLPKVVNVLGIEIASAGEQQYFENLSKAWNINKKLTIIKKSTSESQVQRHSINAITAASDGRKAAAGT
uniref:G_PROTEIN_RECEP_F1_2 domain-containing protein n=1 Tax=Heterorhabditis bacteriophora TaxID=37862 RepID=A0A1I7WQB3_HETBA